MCCKLNGGGGADFGGEAFGVEHEAAEGILVRFKKLQQRHRQGRKQNQQQQQLELLCIYSGTYCVSLRMNQSLNMKYLRGALHCCCCCPPPPTAVGRARHLDHGSSSAAALARGLRRCSRPADRSFRKGKIVLIWTHKTPLRGVRLRFCWKISRGLRFCFGK